MKYIVNSFFMISDITFQEIQITRKSHFYIKKIQNINSILKLNQKTPEFSKLLQKIKRFDLINFIMIGHFA